MPFKKLILVSAITLASTSIAQAFEPTAADGLSCAGGVVAARVVGVAHTLRTHKNMSNAAEAVAMGAGCAGVVAGVRSISEADAREIPDQHVLEAQNLEGEE